MKPLLLVTGATGYVGGRLWRRLEGQGRRVRCLVRRAGSLASRVGPATEVVEGDALDPASLAPALAGVDTAYYLVHSMGSGRDFEEADRTAARNFGQAARRAGVRRIVYLGGLAHGAALSAHLRSRHEVGDVLRASGAVVLEFRASIVLGAGSLSFEMIRALVERLPVMITPRWVDVMAQPIAIDDLLAYLLAAPDVPLAESRIFEIGGADRLSYGDLMREYARQRGLSRTMIRVPVLTPRLSSLWLGLVTPLYARIGRMLIESIRHPSVVAENSALEVFPVRPRSSREAIAAAIRDEEREIVESRWYDAFSAGGAGHPATGARFGNRLVDARTRDVDVPPAVAFAPIRRIGGRTGWYAYDALWKLRGALDLLVGGVGVRRGRPRSDALDVGDALDFWRVEVHEPDRLLRLAAEMKLPGRAWLEFEVVPRAGGATIRQTALFEPTGLFGLVYWYGLLPLHVLVFSGMLDGIARAATAARSARAPGSFSHMHGLPLRTPSLLLRHLVADDAAAMLVLNAEATTARWLPSHADATLAAAASRIAFLGSCYAAPGDPRAGAYVLAIEHVETGRLLGHVGFSPLDGEVEVSYAIGEAFRGRGYGVEALASACTWIASTFGVRELIAITASANVGSRRVLERAAFVLESEGPMMFQGREEVVSRYRWRASVPGSA